MQAKAHKSGSRARVPPRRVDAEAPRSVRTLEEALQRALDERRALEGDVGRMKAQLAQVTSSLHDARSRLNWMEHTRSWMVTGPLRDGLGMLRRLRATVGTMPGRALGFAERTRNEGLSSATRWLGDTVKASLEPGEFDPSTFHRRQLATILARHAGRPIIVAPPLVDWNVPLFQRPQHLAMNLAREGFLYFYCTANAVFDRYEGFAQVAPGCFITDQIDLLLGLNATKIIHLCSTAMRIDFEYVQRTKRRGDRILYEYIDELHPDVSGEIPRGAIERHYALLADNSVACVATADKLLRDVESTRRANYGLVTNGVEYEHFAKARAGLPVPQELAGLASRRRPVIGYFGALAKWFDYEMVRHLARERPGYEVLLIGVDYDGSLKQAGLTKLKNVRVVGPINYAHLPRYAQLFDVSTIPFLINEVTESTSPIKLFEYMALGKPIVTSAMPECKKYESCLIAEDPDDFVAKVDRALELSADKPYQATLEREAQANTWRAKAHDIAQLLERAFHVTPGPRG